MHREQQIVDTMVTLIDAATTGVTVTAHSATEPAESITSAVDVRHGDADLVSFSTSSFEWEVEVFTDIKVRGLASAVRAAVFDLAESVYAALLADDSLGLSYVGHIRPTQRPAPEFHGDGQAAGELRLGWIVSYTTSRTSAAV